MRTRAPGVACAALLALATPLRGQDALSGIGAATEVASIEFRFEDGPSLEEEELRRHIALTARGGLAGLREFLDFIPLVPPVGVHPFDPLELQRDVIRLRHHYQRSGFPKVDVRYDVRYDAKSDQVRVAFVIREGPPLVITALEFTGEGGPLAVPSEFGADWAKFVADERKEARRYGETEQRAISDSTARWFRHAGYPFAVADVSAKIDTAANRAEVMVQVRPGTRARISEIAVAGNHTVAARHLVRPMPVGPGDWYDGSALERGRQQLVQMDIVRHATIEVPDSAADSTVAVRLDVAENPPRLIRAEAGVASGGGLSGEAQWTHRSFLGGLRTLTLGLAAQTGVLALTDPPQQLYRASLTVFQPFVGDRHISVAGGPFVEYRNDLRDRSQAIGFEGTIAYASGPLRSISLGYTISHRRVLDFGLGENLDPTQYLPLLGLSSPDAVGTLDTTRNRSTVSLEGSWGRLDQFANPRRGYVIRPRLEVTTPGGFNTSEYFLADLGATAYIPLGDRIGFTLRGAGGRIFPFGRSLETTPTESPFISLLDLRDVTFTAGGTRDLRGWGSQLAGPKLPEIRVLTQENDAGETVTDTISERYTPIGGLARVSGTVEMQLPMPLLSRQWRSFVFLDGGQVWTPDSRFALNAGEIDQDDFFLSTGVGVGYQTIVGAVQIALGYKLNPSSLDERPPQGVLDALLAGQPIASVPAESRRRWHLHFSIGATF